jgi:hypothetical protein
MKTKLTFELKRGTVTNHPWNDRDVASDYGVPDDGCQLLVNDPHGRDEVLLFHCTTKQAAASIMNGGPQPHVCYVGWGGEPMPSAFWASCVPLIHPYEIWLPHIDKSEGEGAYIGVTVPLDVALKRIYFHHTWPCVQMALQPSDIVSRFIVRDPLAYRSKKAVAAVKRYRKDHAQ